jgi:hypothetical protein
MMMLSWLAQNWAMVLEKALMLVGAASAFVAAVQGAFPNWAPASKAGRFLAKVLVFFGRVALNPKPPAP